MSSTRKCLSCGAVLRTSQRNDVCNPCQEKKREEILQRSGLDGIAPTKNIVTTISSPNRSHREFLTVSEVANRLRKSERWIRDMICDGLIVAQRVPGSRPWLIREEEIDRLLPPPIDKIGSEIARNLREAHVQFESAIEILKSPGKRWQDVENASRMLERIPFRDDTAKLYELYVSEDSNLLSFEEKSEVLEGLRLIFEMNRNRENLASIHLAQRSAHWMARSGEDEFILTIKRLYRIEKNVFLKRGMMLGLALSSSIEPGEILTNFLNEEKNQLLDILAYQMRNKDVPYDLNLIVEKNIKIGNKFDNSLQIIMHEIKRAESKSIFSCSLRTLNNILVCGKESALEGLQRVLSLSYNRKIFNILLTKTGLDALWRSEIEKIKSLIRGRPQIENLLQEPQGLMGT